MEKATLHIKGTVAEVMENNGKLNAKVVCDTDNLLISLENIDHLVRSAHTPTADDMGCQSVDLFALEQHRSAVRHQLTRNQIEQGGLPGTVGTDNRHHLSGGDP